MNNNIKVLKLNFFVKPEDLINLPVGIEVLYISAFNEVADNNKYLNLNLPCTLNKMVVYVFENINFAVPYGCELNVFNMNETEYTEETFQMIKNKYKKNEILQINTYKQFRKYFN
jgi:hypothetical protein